MSRKSQSPPPEAPKTVTADRAARLHRLIRLLGKGPQTRAALRKRLRLDTRGFYRDLEFLRSAGVLVNLREQRYLLGENLKQALAKLPFPDPGLTLEEAMLLSNGRSRAHRKLKELIRQIIA